ncbi:MAG TPA: amidohydrolase [Thermoanaerobaculia bacterium]|jgi:amidohydrolase|nr:amidohydrolase [Thermoanaerobaculia bacterium]
MPPRRKTACLAAAAIALAWTLPALAQAARKAGGGPSALDARIDQESQRVAPQIVELRHRLHQNPELSNRESRTAELVAAHLRSLGLEPRTGVGKTGVLALLKGGRPGPLIAVRADMDALPVIEETDLPFKSTKRDTFLGQEVGVAHACGHDVHTSSLLGVASVLSAVRQDLPGSVLFIFQPAEEGPPPGERGGAELMLDEGAFSAGKPVAVFALHSFPDLPVGQVGFNPGPTMAAVDQFRIKIRGKQAHGAYPHLSVDPVVMAAEAIMDFQTIRSRNVPALEPSVLTVGIVRGGERFNIIPGEVYLEGTVRTYSEDVRNLVERRMREILDGVTRGGGGSYEMEYQRNAPATVNDPGLARQAQPLLGRILGPENVKIVEPSMAGEDFAYFANQTPGFFYRLGVVAPGTTSGGLHTPTFRADDSAVPTGIRVMSRLLADYLSSYGTQSPR